MHLEFTWEFSQCYDLNGFVVLDFKAMKLKNCLLFLKYSCVDQFFVMLLCINFNLNWDWLMICLINFWLKFKFKLNNWLNLSFQITLTSNSQIVIFQKIWLLLFYILTEWMYLFDEGRICRLLSKFFPLFKCC